MQSQCIAHIERMSRRRLSLLPSCTCFSFFVKPFFGKQESLKACNKHNRPSVRYRLKLSKGDVKAVQGDGGWNTPDMVTKRYAHILDEDRKNLASEMEASFYQDGGKTSKAALTPAKTETPPAQAAAPVMDVNALAALLAKDTSLLVKVLQSVQLANNP